MHVELVLHATELMLHATKLMLHATELMLHATELMQGDSDLRNVFDWLPNAENQGQLADTSEAPANRQVCAGKSQN